MPSSQPMRLAVQMLLGGITALSSIGGFSVSSISLLPVVFGGHVSVAGLFAGLVLFLLGPFLFGLLMSGVAQGLLTSLTAPVVGVTGLGFGSLVISIVGTTASGLVAERGFILTFFFAVSVVGVALLLNHSRRMDMLWPAVRGVLITLGLLLTIEGIRVGLRRSSCMAYTPLEDSLLWSLIGIYAFVGGFNVPFFFGFRREAGPGRPERSAIRLLVLGDVLAIVLVSASSMIC